MLKALEKMEDFFEKLFRVPVPKYFSWNEDGDIESHKAWEARMKKELPVRFFLGYTLPLIVSRWLYNIHLNVYLKYKHLWFLKTHLIDLRNQESNPEHIDHYDWGNPSFDKALVIVCTKLLKKFIDEDHYYPTEEDIASEMEVSEDAGNFLKSQKEFHDEVHVLYKYFSEERQNLSIKMHKEPTDKWYATYKNGDKSPENLELAKQLMKESMDQEIKFLDLEEEMLIRLIKIRSRLW